LRIVTDGNKETTYLLTYCAFGKKTICHIICSFRVSISNTLFLNSWGRQAV